MKMGTLQKGQVSHMALVCGNKGSNIHLCKKYIRAFVASIKEQLRWPIRYLVNDIISPS